jgi:hypothetical protein
MFQYNLVKRAKKHRKHIVLPEGNDDRITTTDYYQWMLILLFLEVKNKSKKGS